MCVVKAGWMDEKQVAGNIFSSFIVYVLFSGWSSFLWDYDDDKNCMLHFLVVVGIADIASTKPFYRSK